MMMDIDLLVHCSSIFSGLWLMYHALGNYPSNASPVAISPSHPRKLAQTMLLYGGGFTSQVRKEDLNAYVASWTSTKARKQCHSVFNKNGR